ncbi:MAG: hypothetical protein AAFQ58_10010 [Pseudomonadota bacterium]
MSRRIVQDQNRGMRSQDQGPIALATLLLPWRLAPVILRTENDHGLTGRVVLGLALLAALFVDLSFLVGMIAPAFLWMCSAAIAAYCAALLVFSFVILNALSMRR